MINRYHFSGYLASRIKNEYSGTMNQTELVKLNE